jgi:hypothetical protein
MTSFSLKSLGRYRGIVTMPMGKIAASFVGMTMLVAASPTRASVVLDVNNFLLPPVGWTSGGGVGANYFSSNGYPTDAFQTWTVETAGKLTKIDQIASATGSGDVYLTILGGGTVNVPGAVNLGSISIQNSAALHSIGLLSIDLSALNIISNVGEILTFELSVDSCSVVNCVNTFTNWNSFNINAFNESTGNYAGGSASLINHTGGFPRSDMNFRTYVDTNFAPTGGVPEPASWALMISGFGMAGAVLRRRRGQVALAA